MPDESNLAPVGEAVANQAGYCAGGWKLGSARGAMRLPGRFGNTATYRDPTVRHFDVFRDTSAATAAAGNLAGRILAAVPQRWPETIRAMIVHSAEWTPIMRHQFDAAASEQQKRTLLRKYGYGVPQHERAVLRSEERRGG